MIRIGSIRSHGELPAAPAALVPAAAVPAARVPGAPVLAALLLAATEALAQPVVPVKGLPLEVLSAPIELAIAGQAAALQVVRADDSPEAVAALAESAWSRPGAQVHRDNDGSWRSVSRISQQGIEALQLRASANGGSEGYLIVWQARAAPGETARQRSVQGSVAHRLLPPSAITLSDQATGGAPAERSASSAPPGRTLVAWVRGPIAATDAVLAARAKALGLNSRAEKRAPDAGPQREHARFYSAPGVELALTLHSEGAGTALVIHSTEATP